MHVNLKLLLQVHPRNRLFNQRTRRLRPVRPDHSNELWYKSELLRLVSLLRADTKKVLVPALKFLPQFAGDARPSSISKAFSEMASHFGGIDKTAARLSQLSASKSLSAVDTRLAKSIRDSVGVDISSAFTADGAIRDAMREATKANFDLITSIPQQYFEKLKIAVDKNFVEGNRWEDMIGAIQHVGHVTEDRAKLIARDQTSKMNGSFNKVRQKECGIETYIWQTAGDERVRDTHADNDGQEFSWDNPPEETGNPGDDINCRCVAIPVLKLDGDEE